MAEPCEFGRKSCQWAWGKSICARHGRLWMEGLRYAIQVGGPVQLRNGKWVAVVETKPRLVPAR